MAHPWARPPPAPPGLRRRGRVRGPRRPRAEDQFGAAARSSARASATRSVSTSELPTESPIATRKVQAIAPPMRNLVHAWEQRLQDVDLSGNLRAPHHRDERPLGVMQCLAQVLELLLHEKACDRGLEQMRDAFRRGVCPMGRTEGIVDIEVAERREAAGELGVVRLFARPETRVLDQRHGPAWQLARRRTPCAGSGMNSMGRRAAASRSRTICRSEYLGSGPALGRPRCERITTRDPFSRRIGEGGQGGAQPAVVGHDAVFERDVEVSRTRARLPSNASAGRSRDCASSPRASDVRQQVDATRRVAHFVVVPRRDVHQRAVDHVRGERVHDTRVEAADIVDRNQRFVRHFENALERTLCRLFGNAAFTSSIRRALLRLRRSGRRSTRRAWVRAARPRRSSLSLRGARDRSPSPPPLSSG